VGRDVEGWLKGCIKINSCLARRTALQAFHAENDCMDTPVASRRATNSLVDAYFDRKRPANRIYQN
jgi:hypothetical protein